MKILEMTLKKKWFDMISSGEKKEEYREVKPYWESRICGKEHTHVRFRNGYTKNAPSITCKLRSCVISEGRPEWGAVTGTKYFVLKLDGVV
jgi:hypothetical protein